LTTTSGAATSTLLSVALRLTVFMDVMSSVEIKFTALLSSQPAKIILFLGLTANQIDPRGSVLASDALNNVLLGTNL
jgi:hypothetical protein